MQVDITRSAILQYHMQPILGTVCAGTLCHVHMLAVANLPACLAGLSPRLPRAEPNTRPGRVPHGEAQPHGEVHCHGPAYDESYEDAIKVESFDPCCQTTDPQLHVHFAMDTSTQLAARAPMQAKPPVARDCP